MTLTTAKLTEVPLRSSSSFFFFSSSSTSKRHSFLTLTRIPFCSSSSSSNKTPNPPKSSWLAKWPSRSPPIEAWATTSGVLQPNGREKPRSFNKGENAIERIVLRLRNLGLGPDDEDEDEKDEELGTRINGEDLTGDETLSDLLKREWVRPDTLLIEEDDDDEEEDDFVLPWERKESKGREEEEERGIEMRRRVVKAPTLAEMTIEDEELRRLRKMGMFIRERVSVPKAGLTKQVLEKIHDKWRKQELVRLKFHEDLAHDMKTAHEIVERRTGGLVIWRSGSVMAVYRGSSYQGPLAKPQPGDAEGDALFVPKVSSASSTAMRSDDVATLSTWERIDVTGPIVRRTDCRENMTEEEVEFNNLLDGLGPRFEEWWGTGILPVDADLLPQEVPGYKTPFRLLPTGMRSRLTNAEMTNMRKFAKSLPCHFALGRNRNHQGLAVAILKLWEKSLIVKIAVKRGIQNTNNKLMADELKKLTGGVLLLRNKYFIVMYRGKDFLPTTVAAALAERQEVTKKIQDVEEKVRSRGVEAALSGEGEGNALAGTLAEFYEAQSRWGRVVSAEEREKMIEEASRAENARLMKRLEHKIAVAQAKKLRAERLLAKIEASMLPTGPDYDQETITDEERVMFRRLGLRMKAYLPLGIRGVFDGVIENMHLHWKHRELVKLISKQKTLAFVEDTARLLEYESGGILVAIERVPKGFALIYYRGKNYRRPISLRPRNLLTKAKALKRSVAMQRHEAFSQHISELERNIEQMKSELGPQGDENNWTSEEHSQSGDEASFFGSDWEEEEDEEDDKDDYETEKDLELS